MDLLDDGRLRNIEEIIVTLEVFLPLLKALSAKGRLFQLIPLIMVPMAPSRIRMRSRSS